MFYRAELKENAKKAMQGNWPQILLTVGLMAIIYISLCIVSARSEDFNLGDLLLLLLEGPVLISFCAFMLHLMHHGTVSINDYFNSFGNIVKWMLAGLWQTLWIILWILLLIIPGVIKSFSYSQYYFILADNPDADLRQALKTSIRMTKGYKGELFVAYLSFFNWIIAAVIIYYMFFAFLPQGLAFLSGMTVIALVCLYLLPYMTGTFAGIYEYLKNQAISSGVCDPEEFGIYPETQTASYDDGTKTVLAENYNQNVTQPTETLIENKEQTATLDTDEDVLEMSPGKQKLESFDEQ